MRFWSLKTFRSICFHGTFFHSSIGSFTVVMTSALRLVPLSSRSPCLRRHIPRLSRGRWLLRQSHSPCACGGHLLLFGEHVGRYSVPEHRLPLSLGSHFSPGYFGVQSGFRTRRSSRAAWGCEFHHVRFGPSRSPA